MKKLIALSLISILSLSLLTSCADNSGTPAVTESTGGKESTDGKETISEAVNELPEFTGLEPQNQIGLGNSLLNCKGVNGVSYFCSSDDAVYFTNFNDNAYIYMLKENVSSLVVEKSACCINYYNGKLYFLSSDFDPAESLRYRGQIYSFDIESKECKLLLDKDAAKMLVTDDGIYYLQLEEESENILTYSSWMMDFEGNASKRNYGNIMRYGKYVIDNRGAYELSENKLDVDRENGFTAFPFDINSLDYCVYDNYLVMISQGKIIFFDLTSGEINEISDTEISEALGGANAMVSDFTIIGDFVYIAYDSSGIIRKNMKTNEIKDIPIRGMNNIVISDLYTDGKSLFGVAASFPTMQSLKIVSLKETMDEEISHEVMQCEVLN